MQKRKIVWINDVPWASSGMGIQSRMVVGHLAKLGHEIHYLAWYAGKPLQTTEYTIDTVTIKVHFLGEQSFGNTALVTNIISKIKPDIVVSFGDMHMIAHLVEAEAEWKQKWIHWWTVDDKQPSSIILELANKIPRLMALTNFGAKTIKTLLGRDAPVIGHAYQVERGKRNEQVAKSLIGVDGSVVLYGCIARNFWRKNLHTLLHAFGTISQACNRARLLIHTDDMNPGFEGCNIPQLVESLGLTGKVLISNANLNQEAMQTLIDAMDYHVLPSYGEGFGVPVIETMARGIPNIVPDHTTLPELVDSSGFIVPLAIGGNVHPKTGQEYRGPDLMKLANTLTVAYKIKTDRPEIYLQKSNAALARAARYSPDRMLHDWQKLIENFDSIPAVQDKSHRPISIIHKFEPRKKKLLLCSIFYVPNLIGGGEYTAHELMKGLQDNGWSIKVLTLFEGIKGKQFGAPLADREVLIEDINVLQSGNHWYHHLKYILDNDPPDILLTYEITSWYSARFLREAKTRGIKTAMYEQYWRLLSENFECLSSQIPTPPRHGLECNRLTDLMIVNSEFSANMFKKFLGRDSTIVYPPVNFPPKANTVPGKYVVMVNPSKAKGVEVVFYLAASFPGVSFKLVGGIGEDETFVAMKKFPNITYCAHTEDMAEVYQDAKIVLFPSTLEESFGRVPVEALSYGIPVIARETGAVPGVLENNAILIPRNAPMEKWKEELARLLENQSTGNQLGAHRRNFVLQKFDKSRIINKIDSCLSNLVKQPILQFKMASSPVKLIAVCDERFSSVQAALEYAELHFKDRFVFCPIFFQTGKDQIIDVIQTIDKHNAQVIMFCGWTDNYVGILKKLKLYRPYLHYIINWHSPLAQTEMAGKRDIDAFIRCNQLLVTKEIDYVFVPYEKDAKLFRHSYHENYRWFPDTIAPIHCNPVSLNDDYFRVGFFALPSPRKNLMSQFSAIRLLHLMLEKGGKWKGAKLYIGNGFGDYQAYIDFLEMLDIPYQILPFFKNKQDYYNHLGAMHLNTQVTFSEAFNYVCAESLALGVPCLGSLMTPALLATTKEMQDIFDRLFIINKIDDTMETFNKMHSIALMAQDDYASVCNIVATHIRLLMFHHNSIIKQLFDEIYEKYGFTPRS